MTSRTHPKPHHTTQPAYSLPTYGAGFGPDDKD